PRSSEPASQELDPGRNPCHASSSRSWPSSRFCSVRPRWPRRQRARRARSTHSRTPRPMRSSSTTAPLPASSPGPARSRRAGAAQVQFSPSGDVLVVTEKSTSSLDVFVVGKDGVAGAATRYGSSGTTPFGFGFGHRGDLVVSEAAGAAPLSAASSYELSKDGALTAISRSVPTTQAAACWVAVTKDGRYA